MTINGYARHGDDLDVPDFLKPDWTPDKTVQTIPGELVEQPADDPDEEDDIAPGVIEYVPYRRPVLSVTGSAAMVVLAKTGSGVTASARGGWACTRWFGVGLGAVTHLGYRYVRAHDVLEDIGGKTSKADLLLVKRERQARWKLLGWATGGLLGVDLGAWIGLAVWTPLSSLTALAAAPTVEALAAGAALTLYGRYRLNAQLAPTEIVAAEDIDDGDEPFPLAWCKDGQQVAECVSRALAYEGVGTRRISILGHRDWGWEIDIDLKGSTPGKVNGAADQLESHMGLPDGGLMIEPDTKDKAHIVVRLVQTNPFADMPHPATHAPKSLSVHDVIPMGRAMDGSVLELTLDGFCALVIGAMGAGKTLGALRTINEALTACRDAAVWDLDPIKGGLSEFGDLMSRRARTPEECEEALEEALSYVSARRNLMGPLGMGDRWHATPEHPNLYINIDEFIQLSPKGKDLAVRILRTGRQYGIYLIMAGQEATADALGDAVAMVIAYRILMACRFEDVRIAFGPGAGALGWRPDRMKPAVGPVSNDAGQAMIMGGPFVRAIRYQFHKYGREQITAAVPERVAAGVVSIDADTLLKAGANLTSTGQRGSLAARLDAHGRGDAEFLATLVREYERMGRDFLPTNEVLLPALHGADMDDIDATALSNRLRKHAPGAKADRRDCAEGKWLRGWARADIERAAAGLLDPAQARQNPGTTPA